MTSLVGASGEDFASVLRSLGYRMERRPKPPEPIVETKPQEANAETEAEPSNDAVTLETAETDKLTGQQTARETVKNENETVSSLPSDESDAPEEGSESEVLVEPEDATEAQARAADHDYDPVEPQTDISELTAPASAHSEQIDIGADAGSTHEQTDQQTNELLAAPASDQANQQGAAAADQAEAAPVAAAEPELIEVWRRGRFDRAARSHRPGPRRPPRHDRHHGTGDARAGAPVAGMPESDQVAAQSAEPPPDRRPHRKRPERPHRAAERPDRGEPRQDRGERGGRPPRPQRFGGPRREESGGKAYNQSAAAPRREREPDPNSPFAKLAALKAQLEADAKERR
jgi:ATP-dependent RNA helicase SUPV3L1/SUV3